jgi:multiple antibiotic resistance protein
LENASFVFTVSFMLLGPLKIIPAFIRLTRNRDRPFKRELAIKASLIASATVYAAAFIGEVAMARYRISIDAVRLAGGLVLLISALRIMFPKPEAPSTESQQTPALQLAISPLAMPIIVSPPGIAAIVIFEMLAAQNPGLDWIITLALAAMMALDFLIMFFCDRLVAIPGFTLLLQVFGSVLVFVQVALAIKTMIAGFKGIGV